MQYILATTNIKIALVACVKQKQDSPCQAKDMYVSEDFKAWMKYAKAWGADKIFILSGKYGLLELTKEIKPYDFNLNVQSKSFRSAWAENVLTKLAKEASFESDHFLILSSRLYAEDLSPNFKYFEMPLDIT
jgi:cytoplasmic iron level regulating protein YaaA (DUF328/UPF0246 family)